MENLKDLPPGPRVVGAKKCTSVRCPDCSSGASNPGASSARPVMRNVAFSRRISVKYAESGRARDSASMRITLEMDVSFKNHARYAGGSDATEDGVRPP